MKNFPAGKRRLFNVVSTCIDVKATLYTRHLSAGFMQLFFFSVVGLLSLIPLVKDRVPSGWLMLIALERKKH